MSVIVGRAAAGMEVVEAPEEIGRLFDAWMYAGDGMLTETHWYLKEALYSHRLKWLVRGEHVFRLDRNDHVRVYPRSEPYPRGAAAR